MFIQTDEKNNEAFDEIFKSTFVFLRQTSLDIFDRNSFSFDLTNFCFSTKIMMAILLQCHIIRRISLR